MKNIVKTLITASRPAALAISMSVPLSPPAQNIKPCDITGGHLVSVPVPAPHATLPPPPPQPPVIEIITGIRG